ncbi:hypothetical protein Q1695_001392 [Nippostrongylus brasiliensis]|nr:hypothetical protein Q1695_001392 [Nippostrongylus brasiliensis]
MEENADESSKSKFENLDREHLMRYVRMQFQRSSKLQAEIKTLKEKEEKDHQKMSKMKNRLEELERICSRFKPVSSGRNSDEEVEVTETSSEVTRTTETNGEGEKHMEMKEKSIEPQADEELPRSVGIRSDVSSMELQDYVKKTAELKQSLKEALDAVAVANERNKELNDELMTANSKVADLSEKLTVAQKQLDHYTASLEEEKQASYELLKAKLALQTSLDTLVRDRDDEASKAESKLSEYNGKIEELQKSLDAKVAEVKQLTTEKKDLHEKFVAVQTDFTFYKKRAKFVFEQYSKAEKERQQEMGSRTLEQNLDSVRRTPTDSSEPEDSQVSNDHWTVTDTHQEEFSPPSHEETAESHFIQKTRIKGEELIGDINSMENAFQSFAVQSSSMENVCRRLINAARDIKDELLETQRINDRNVAELNDVRRQLIAVTMRLASSDAKFDEMKEHEAEQRRVQKGKYEEIMNSLEKTVEMLTNDNKLLADRLLQESDRADLAVRRLEEVRKEFGIAGGHMAADDAHRDPHEFGYAGCSHSNVCRNVDQPLAEVLFGDDRYMYDERESTRYDEVQELRQKVDVQERELKRLTQSYNLSNNLLNDAEKTIASFEEQVNVLKEEIRRLRRNDERVAHAAKLEHMKNVILKFLGPERVKGERSQLVPILSTVLCLTSAETEKVKQFATEYESTQSRASEDLQSCSDKVSATFFAIDINFYHCSFFSTTPSL